MPDHPLHPASPGAAFKSTAGCYLLMAILPCILLPTNGGAQDIVLGMSAAFKGPSRGLGIEMYRGSMAYFEHVNETGGIGGRKIVIKAYDDGYNPLPTIRNTIQLIEQDNVFLLYGYVGTPTVTRVLPLLKLYEERSVFLFFPFTGAQPQRIPRYDAFAYNLRASYHQETEGLIERLADIGRTKIAVLYQMDAYGRDGWEGVRKALERRERKMVSEATYHRGDKFGDSFHQQVKLLKRADPDAVMCVGSYAACAGFIRDARDVGWQVPITNVSFVGSENLLKLLQEHGAKKGLDYTKDLITSQVVPSYHSTKLPAVREYLDFMAKYQPMPDRSLLEDAYQPVPQSYVSFEGFLDAKLLAAILRKMGEPWNRSRLKGAVEAIKDFDLGIDDRVSFGPHTNQGLNKVYFTTVEEGRFVPIASWERWRR